MTTDLSTPKSEAQPQTAVRSVRWLDSECVKPAASSGHVASQRSGGCDDSTLTLLRVWDMPNKHTFRIATVKCLLRRFVGNGRGWADPFANNHSPAEYTNDLNPDTMAQSHLDAVEFLRGFGDGCLNGVLLDPPYSMHQCTVSYEEYGHGRVIALTPVYDEIKRVVKTGGFVLSFGWNSNGIGAVRGFALREIVLIPHGGHHNDTIVTVEVKNEVTPELAGLAATLTRDVRGSRNTTAEESNEKLRRCEQEPSGANRKD